MEEDNEKRVQLDEILKQLFDCSQTVLVNMMNSLFHENFDADLTDVTFENNEFVTDSYDIIRGDLFLKIIQNEKPNHFHIELQTMNDATMVIRLFEYGFKRAKQYAKLETKNETIIYIPKQVVIFVEENRNIHDELRMRLIFPDDQEVQYVVPVWKNWEYDDKRLIDQKLYPLLPLQVFKLRYKMKKLKRKRDSKQLLQETVNEAKVVAETIAIEAKVLYEKQEITGDDLHSILKAIANLFEYMNVKYGNDATLEKEVRLMTKTLFDPLVEQRGIEKGIEQGIEQGRRADQLEVARAALVEGASMEFVVKITKLDLETVQTIFNEIQGNV